MSYLPRNYKTAIRILKLLARKRILSTQEIAEYRGESNGSPFPHSHNRIKSQMERLTELDFCEQYGLVTNKNHICQLCDKSTSYFVKTKQLNEALKRIARDTVSVEKYHHMEIFDRNIYCVCKPDHVLGKLVSLRCKGCDNNTPSNFEEEYNNSKYRYWSLSDNGKLVLLTLLKPKSLNDFILENSDHKIINAIRILREHSEQKWVDILITKLKQHVKDDPNVSKIAIDWLDDQYRKHKFFNQYIDSTRSSFSNC